MIKKKCITDGTLYSVDYVGECNCCDGDMSSEKWFFFFCEEHNVKLGSVSECSKCEVEHKIEEYDCKERDWKIKRRELEDKIDQKDRELGRLRDVERTLNDEIATLSGSSALNFFSQWMNWLEGPTVNQTECKSLFIGSLLGSLAIFLYLNDFTFFGGMNGDWVYHISGWFTAVTAGILASQLLWRLNLTFVSFRGGKLIISICWGTILAIFLNASWGILFFDYSVSFPTVFTNAVVVVPIMWWALRMNSRHGESRRSGWRRLFYYGTPYFPWGGIFNPGVPSGLRIHPFSRAKTLICLGISLAIFLYSLWAVSFGLSAMVKDTAHVQMKRAKGINPRYHRLTETGY